MSRWVESFNSHAFWKIWHDITETSSMIVVDDETIVTDTEEIARLKKVITFINELLESCDPELIPLSTWNNFHTQSAQCKEKIDQYQSSRIISHIKSANDHLDNLLSYVKPYQVTADQAAKSASTAFIKYTETIHANLNSFHDKSSSLITDIKELKSQANINASDLETVHNKIKNLDKIYFDDSDSESLSTKITKFEHEIKENHKQVGTLKTELLDGDSENESTSLSIKKALTSAEVKTAKISKILNEVQDNISDFKEFHTGVFGKKNEDTNELEGGLKHEIATRQQQLDEFKKQQELKYETLNKEIESLLPGATSAGLASAYLELKNSFDKPILTYSSVFYGSILVLMIVSLISVTQEIGWSYIKFIDITNLESLASNILYKLPIVLPILWLSLFASRRRSEAQRLQQEYAHKEALAKSYQNFKMQIEALGSEDKDLMKKLLNSAIDAVSMNASNTLDKKHGDQTPVNHSVDSLIETVEKVKKTFIK